GACIWNCNGKSAGDYMSCVRCNVYATCTVGGQFMDNRPCAPATPPLVWNDNLKRCDYTSQTW
ncbi:hypothetical protein LSAT2_027470, partial [Lamellibrachia satsuma]